MDGFPMVAWMLGWMAGSPVDVCAFPPMWVSGGDCVLTILFNSTGSEKESSLVAVESDNFTNCLLLLLSPGP